MFASLVMASRGHPFLVWLGTALAFLVHVVIAVSIGVSLFKILPQEVVDAHAAQEAALAQRADLVREVVAFLDKYFGRVN